MKLVIGNLEVEVVNGGRLVYDSAADTLNIQPSTGTPARRIHSSKPLMIEHESPSKPAPTGLTKSVLTHKVLSLIKQTEGAASIQSITRNSLGDKAPYDQRKYLMILLDELVDKGTLVVHVESGRRRFSLA